MRDDSVNIGDRDLMTWGKWKAKATAINNDDILLKYPWPGIDWPGSAFDPWFRPVFEGVSVAIKIVVLVTALVNFLQRNRTDRRLYILYKQGIGLQIKEVPQSADMQAGAQESWGVVPVQIWRPEIQGSRWCEPQGKGRRWDEMSQFMPLGRDSSSLPMCLLYSDPPWIGFICM